MGKPCRDCGEQIEFARLRGGNFHPVESLEPEEYRVWDEDHFSELAGALIIPAGVEVTGIDPDRRIARRTLLVFEGEVLTTWRQWEKGRRVDGPLRLVALESHQNSCRRGLPKGGQGGGQTPLAR